MNMLKLLTLCGVILLSACATQSPCPTTTLETSELVTEQAVGAAFQPISASRQDTPETLDQIRAHNNVYWCANAPQRPEGFDPTVCKSGGPQPQS